MTSTVHRVELSTTDVATLDSMFGPHRPVVGARVPLDDDVVLEVVDTRIERGVVETSIFLDFALKVGSGVAVKVIGDLLSERLKGRKASVKINGATVQADDARAIEIALTDGKQVG